MISLKYPEAQRCLNKAKVKLMCTPNTVFISTILFNLKQIWTEKVPTAATNGIYLKINPVWFVGLEPGERIGLLAHETWHVAWNHMQRGMHKKDKAKYNEAGDHIINLTISDSGMEIPPGGLCNTQYRGMSTGEVYNLLPTRPPGSGGAGGNDNGQDGMANDVVFNDPGQDEAAAEQQQAQVQNTIVKAMVQSQMSSDEAGSIPGELRRDIEDMINPKLPWKAILQNAMNNYAKSDYSFRRPNRRFFPEFYLPSAYSERLENISVFIDLSGSITDSELQAFLSEIQYIHGTMKPEKMFVGGFDTRITDKHEVTEFQDIRRLTFKGGGGTSLAWLPNWVEKNKPTVLIIFSDMYVNMPSKPKGNTDYIWIIIDNEEAVAPFGRAIHYEHES